MRRFLATILSPTTKFPKSLSFFARQIVTKPPTTPVKPIEESKRTAMKKRLRFLEDVAPYNQGAAGFVNMVDEIDTLREELGLTDGSNVTTPK